MQQLGKFFKNPVTFEVFYSTLNATLHLHVSIKIPLVKCSNLIKYVFNKLELDKKN